MDVESNRESVEACKGPSPDHSSEIRRINRVKGQLDGILRMIEDNRHCPEILIQTRAVRAAVKSLEASILERHLQSCVQKAFESRDKGLQQEMIDELLTLFKKGISTES